MSRPRLRMDEFGYELPASAIAHVPTEPRDAARLLVDRGPGKAPEHRRISDLGALLEAGDLLVVNETRVMPARLPLRKRTGGTAEVLLLEPLAAGATGDGEALWAALVRPSRRIADGTVLVSERDPNVEVVVGSRLDRQRRAVRVLVGGTPLVDASQARLLERAGEAPLPPYIDVDTARSAVAQRIGADVPDGDATRAALADRYQTVYARADGSSAAPTAGLHLTERVLDALRSKGVGVATVDLTVGLATFAPVTAEHADEHEMHIEHYRVPAETLAACAGAERVVAVGTTTVRALEAAGRPPRPASSGSRAVTTMTTRALTTGALTIGTLTTGVTLTCAARPICSCSAARSSWWSTRCSPTFTCRDRRCCCSSMRSSGRAGGTCTRRRSRRATASCRSAMPCCWVAAVSNEPPERRR